jgi:hypothetical protein
MCCGPLRLCASAAEVVGQQLFFEPPPDPRMIPPADDRAW